jgi:hypothetical protein
MKAQNNDCINAIEYGNKIKNKLHQKLYTKNNNDTDFKSFFTTYVKCRIAPDNLSFPNLALMSALYKSF